MPEAKQAALLVELVDSLRRHESWCGETHIQKATYVLKELHGLPLEPSFILYKHGPFSFALRDELASMRADGLLALQSQPPYGPRFAMTEAGQRLRDRFPKTVGAHREAIETVAERLGSRTVGELERLATALYVTHQEASASVEQRAETLIGLKPHVTRQEAELALEEVDGWRGAMG